ncbi:MAG: hypothetical protein ABI324_28020 [Ktedonobacteraceae bacterium]
MNFFEAPHGPQEGEAGADEAILHFALQGILPAGHTLAFDTRSGVLARLLSTERGASLVGVQTLTPSEISLLAPLLHSYPHYCPYEVLQAYFTNASENVTEKVIEQVRRRLHAAIRAGVFEHEMRPARNVLSRVRGKTCPLGIDIISMLETGYLLRPATISRGTMPLGVKFTPQSTSLRTGSQQKRRQREAKERGAS